MILAFPARHISSACGWSAIRLALRIIGCGSFDRGDDAAGLLVARRLQALGVENVDRAKRRKRLSDGLLDRL